MDHKEFMNEFASFWDKRIVGKSVVPIFYEHLFGQGGSNALELLMKGMKHEGYLLGSMDKLLTKGQKIAIGVIIGVLFAAVILYIILKNQGMLPI